MSNEKEQKTAQEVGPAIGAGVPARAGTFAPKKGLEEGMDREEIIIPRAKLLQGLSPEVVEDQKERKGVMYPGLIINSLTKEILPKEFIPIMKFTEWIRFNPRKKEDENFDPAFDPGALIYRTRNADDPRVKKEAVFGPNGEAPACTRFMNFLAYFPGLKMPVVVSFCNTSFKTGKELLNILQYEEGEIYSRKFSLISKEDKNDKGEYFIFKIAPAGKASEEEYKVAERWYADLKPILAKIETHQEAENFEGKTQGAGTQAPY